MSPGGDQTQTSDVSRMCEDVCGAAAVSFVCIPTYTEAPFLTHAGLTWLASKKTRHQHGSACGDRRQSFSDDYKSFIAALRPLLQATERTCTYCCHLSDSGTKRSNKGLKKVTNGHHAPLLPLSLLVIRLEPAALDRDCPARSWSANQLAKWMPSTPMQQFLRKPKSQMRTS